MNFIKKISLFAIVMTIGVFANDSDIASYCDPCSPKETSECGPCCEKSQNKPYEQGDMKYVKKIFLKPMLRLQELISAEV